jgi:hypothetical protein
MNSPAALCLLCSRDPRRVEAGQVIRNLAVQNQESLEETFLKEMNEKGVSELTAKAFWFSHEALTKRWGVKEIDSSMHISLKSSEKQTNISFPVVFSIHVPRA